MATSAIKKIPGKTLTKINQKVGFRFITKFGEKGIINLGKLVPGVGALIGGSMDYAQWFSERLTQLRMEKGVSARDMSLSLGQRESYINKIENRRTMPSMTGFFYICEYLEITPQEFFDTNTLSPCKTAAILQQVQRLSPAKADHVLQLLRDLNGE